MKPHRRILVIDHSPRERARLIEPLRAAGYEVAWADSAADGAATFGTFGPHLVFIAARLPRTHGTVLCRELKRTDAGQETPIVLVVEAAEVQIDLPPLDQFGADRLLRKPLSRAEILDVAETFLQDPDETLPGRVEEKGLEDPGDGLAHALEELDNVDFDLPDEIVNGPRRPGASTPDPVPVSDDAGVDIDDRLDHLFGREAPPPAKPRPRRDTEPDAARPAPQPAAEVKPAPQPRPAPRPERQASAAPPVSAPAVGTFQTAVLTRNRPAPAPAVAPEARSSKLRRRSLMAVSATVILVALAFSWLQRKSDGGSPPPREPDVTEEASAEAAAPPLVAVTLPTLDSESDDTHWAHDRSAQPAPATEPPAVEVPEEKPAPKPEPVKTREPAAVVAQNPVVEEPPVRRRPVVEKPAVVVHEPEPKPESKTADPQPTVEEPAAKPAAVTPPAEPITRPPLLLQRVEPRLTPKELKDGPGEVVLRVLVNERGSVSRVIVERGIPGSPLESAAVAAVLRWRYEPALERDVPVEAWVTTTFVYD